MKKTLYIFSFLYLLSMQTFVWGQGSSCSDLSGFCTSTGVTFPAGVNQTDADITNPGNYYDCLLTTPNPAWYYLEVQNSGTIDILLTNSANEDVDFIVWGPFTSLVQAEALCDSYGIFDVVDCSYSLAATEQISIPGAVSGEVYVLLVTNYSNNPTNISATQNGGTGSTNCSVLCGTVGFDIDPVGPYNCNDAAVDLFAYDDATANGYVAPSFDFVVLTDAYSDLENTVTIYENGVAIGCFGQVFGGCSSPLGPIDANTTFTLTGTYFTAGATYTLEWCDNYGDGSFPYQLIDNNTGLVLNSGTFNFTGTPGCQSFTFTLNSTAVFSGTGVTNFNNGTGTFDPSVAGVGTHTITYNYSNGANCSGTASQTVTVVNPFNASWNPPAPICQGSTTLINLNSLLTGTAGGVWSGTGVVGNNFNPTGLIAGTYPVTYTVGTALNCQAVLTQNITISPAPAANFSYNASAYCLNGADPILTIGVGATAGTFTSVPPLGGLASNGTVSLAGSTAGSYTITNNVNVGGCLATFSVPMTLSAAGNADFVYSTATFCQTATNPLPAYPTGGTAGVFSSTPAGLSLNTLTGEITLSTSTNGTYTVTNIVTAAGCPNDTAQFTVSVVTAPNAEFSYPNNSYCQNGTNPTPLHLSGGTNGVYTSTAGLVINSATGVIDLANSLAGTYTITNTIAAAGGCAGSVFTQTVTISAPGNAEFTYGTSTFCQSGTNPMVTHVAGGTNGVYSSSPAGLSLNTVTGEINLLASAAGTYTVTNTVAGTGACPAAVFTQIVTITTTPNAEFSYASATYCQSAADPTPLHLAGGSNGIYSSTAGLIINATTGVIDLSASNVGTYTVTNTIAASGTCAGSTFTQTVTITAAPDALFSYGVVNFCQTSSTNPMPSYPTGGTSGVFTAAPAGISINSVTGEILLASSTPGTYIITNTVAGGAGCPASVATQTITIGVGQSAEFSYSTTTFCQSSITNPTVLHLNGGIDGVYSYVAVNGGTLSLNPSTGEINLAASTPGVYQITNTIPPNGGCAGDIAQFIVIITPDQSAAFNYDASAYCIGGNNPLLTLAAGATAGLFTYTSSTGGALNLNPATGSISWSGTLPGTYTIVNTVAPAGGCSGAVASQVIVVTGAQSAEFAYDNVDYCKNAANPILSHTTGVDGVYSYVAISGGPTLALNPATGAIDISGSDEGVYEITNTIPAVGGCPASVHTEIIVIESAPDAEFFYDKSTYCGVDIPVIAHNTGVNGTYTYTTISGGPSLLLNPTTGSIDLTFSNPGLYQISNIVGGNGTCPADTYTVTLQYAANPIATVNPTGAFDLCNFGSVTLYATGGVAYQWLNYGTGTGIVTDSLVITQPGNYSVVAFNTEGCADTTNGVLVSNIIFPSADVLTGNVTLCAGETVPLLAQGQGASFQWLQNGSPIAGATGTLVNVSDDGIYAFVAANACGADTSYVTVTESEGPEADFFFEPSPNAFVGQPVSFTDQTVRGATWSWSFGNGATAQIQNPDFTYNTSGTYNVTMFVQDAFGCSDTITYPINVILFSIDSLFIPNIFTPNGDGTHDEVNINTSGFSDYSFEIFDRWGVKVFETTNPKRKWNGYNTNGAICSQGVYFYHLLVKDAGGKSYQRKGNITLSR